LYIIRSPVISSKKSWIVSLSLNAYMKDVPNSPMSVPNAPKNIKWLAIRFISASTTRMYSARSGGLIPASLSTAST